MLRFLSFLGVGVIATSVQYLILIASVQGLHADPVVASTVGFVIAATVNYILNRRYTFGSSKPHLEAAPKFFVVAAGCVLLWNYSINAVWTFTTKAHGRPL